MMDALKFAFEILIVGALALPWLAILIRIFDHHSAPEKPKDDAPLVLGTMRSLNDEVPFHLSVVPDAVRSAVAAAFVIAVGYLLGSAVSRISRDFFNDELLRPLPTEDQIREGVYRAEYCSEDVLGAQELPVKGHARFPELLCVDEKVGGISRSGLYTAPASIASKYTVTLTATSTADPTKKETAEITLTPPYPPSKVTIVPQAAELTAGQTKQFTATVTGSGNTGNSNTAVSWALPPFMDPESNALQRFHERVQEMFLLQESNLLLSGQDKVDRLRQYFDQITVLRGAAFNGFILFFVCLFGYLANAGRSRWRQRVLKTIALLLAGVLAGYALISLSTHWQNKANLYSDPPLAELVLLLLGAGGFFVIFKAKREGFYLPACIVAAVLTLISFGGWWWTEVMYDLQVIHSQPELLGPLPRPYPGSE